MMPPVRPAQYLLIDISNSFTKLAFASSKRLMRTRRIPTREFSSAYLRKILKEQRPETIVISSVVPDRNKAIRTAARGIRLLWLSAKINLGVGVEYPEPESIGADRLANAAAVAVLYGHPAVVVDFGTAVTFDVVSERKR